MVEQALRSATAALSTSSASARADALLLLARIARRSREWIVANPNALLTAEQIADFTAACTRRRHGVPIAYLLRSAGFYGRGFLVDESVLVPRPETEHLVDEALRFINAGDRAQVLDVGTGCGPIACTIAAESAAHVDATDISADALTIARKNATHCGVADRCRFHHGDLAEPVAGSRYDMIVANLPYIPTADLPTPPSAASFEPKLALDGGRDGLALYRRLMPQIKPLMKPRALLLLEAAPPTIEKLKELVGSALPNFAISVGHDYAGLARYVKAWA
jgi:release factor glutamine methyltransferase